MNNKHTVEGQEKKKYKLNKIFAKEAVCLMPAV